MQAKESVEVEHRFLRNINRRTRDVVGSFAVGHDNIQTVRSAALEEHDQTLRLRAWIGSSISGPRQKGRQRRCAHHGEGAVTKENSAGDGHTKTWAAGLE